MKPLISAGLLLLVFQDTACDHRSHGESKPVSLDEVQKAFNKAAKAFEWKAPPVADRRRSMAWDSGLPSCKAHNSRRVIVEQLPENLPSLYFAPAGTVVPAEAVLIPTSSRSFEGISAMSDDSVARRLGVKCRPTLVKKISPTEVELVEGD